MLDYTQLKDMNDLTPWPSLVETFGARIIEGDPQQKGRLDSGDFESRIQVGVWECTPGKFDLTYAVEEFCTLVSGHIRITDAQGEVHQYGAGDSFYTVKGEHVVWEILDTVRKIFVIHNTDGNHP